MLCLIRRCSRNCGLSENVWRHRPHERRRCSAIRAASVPCLLFTLLGALDSVLVVPLDSLSLGLEFDVVDRSDLENCFCFFDDPWHCPVWLGIEVASRGCLEAGMTLHSRP